MLVEFDIQYLTKFTYFIVIMLVKCTLNVLHGKFINVGNILNKVREFS